MKRIGHYTQLPEGWVLAPMQMLCSLIDGEKVNGKELPYLDVKSLRGERGFKCSEQRLRAIKAALSSSYISMKICLPTMSYI